MGDYRMNMNNHFFKALFSGLLSFVLIFSTFASVLAAGGGGGGGGTGGGDGGGVDPIAFEGAYLTTISGNVSTTGENINGSSKVDVNPTIKLVFNKNVVSATIWEINSQAFTLADSGGQTIAINIRKIPDEGDNANPNEKRNIFVSPVAALIPGETYTLTIKASLTANNTSTLGHKETITFTVKADSTPPVLIINTPADLTKTDKEKIVVSGSTEIGSVVKINNTEVTVDEEGLFNHEVTLSVGLNKIEITATDAAGNTNTVTLNVTYQKDEQPVLKGWVPSDGKWYYYDPQTGTMKTGWLFDKNKWYYLQKNGEMKNGWLLDAGKWYYLDSSGAMKTGWVKLGFTWYYLEKNGAMKTGWLLNGGKWYYLDSSGAMKTSWIKSGTTWYYLEKNGAMKTGWLLTGGKWYYLDNKGAMKTGWVHVGTKWYYLYASGQMAANTTIQGYKLDSNGAWIK
jgi:glucan-binding YG repeat protein